MMPMTTISTMPKMMDALRLSFSSWPMDCTFVSKSEMADVAAANNTSRKKRMPTRRPPVKLANTCGIVMNTNPGPDAFAASSPPNATTAGMIIMPARNATDVSKSSTWFTLETRSSSFRIYEPYVIMMPMAMDSE